MNTLNTDQFDKFITNVVSNPKRKSCNVIVAEILDVDKLFQLVDPKKGVTALDLSAGSLNSAFSMFGAGKLGRRNLATAVCSTAVELARIDPDQEMWQREEVIRAFDLLASMGMMTKGFKEQVKVWLSQNRRFMGRIEGGDLESIINLFIDKQEAITSIDLSAAAAKTEARKAPVEDADLENFDWDFGL